MFPIKKNIYLLIIMTILINSIGLFEPLMRNDDPVLYATIAKHMVLSGDWIDLIFQGQDWLDKPHFPFWLTAISFKIFGINAFAYVLPGFLFNLLGAYYTYRLAKHFYNHEVGLISALIYITSLHLLISAMDVRAEAYLLGEIMPACYYWLIYERNSSVKTLVLASIFTAWAMMTKGLFVVITIFSGIIAVWLYNEYVNAWVRHNVNLKLKPEGIFVHLYMQFRLVLRSLTGLRHIISPKWLLAYLLCLIFILPELAALYLQFDIHPDKVVFGHTHVSGIIWYFWGSQFGRFFNSGPIVNTQGNPLFFVHTYLWAFLPWSLIFIGSIYNLIKSWRSAIADNEHIGGRRKAVYLLASFWITFIMFSATKFQLDHYTNIIMPFAAIICARYLYIAQQAVYSLNSKTQLTMSASNEEKIVINSLTKYNPFLASGLVKLTKFQTGINILLLSLNAGIIVYLFRLSLWSCFAVIPLITLISIISSKSRLSYLKQNLIYSTLAICSVFILVLIVNGKVYKDYDVGYNVAQIINQQQKLPVYDLNVRELALEFNLHYPYFIVKNFTDLPTQGNYYVFMRQHDWQTYAGRPQIKDKFVLSDKFCGNTIDKIIPHYADKSQLKKYLECFVVVKHIDYRV